MRPWWVKMAYGMICLNEGSNSAAGRAMKRGVGGVRKVFR